MGLVAWYPLNGSLEDYSGNNNSVLSSLGVTWGDNGKIGKCYTSDGSSYIRIDNPIKSLTKFTISFWMKENEADTWSDIFTITDGVSSNSCRVEKTDTLGTYRWYIDGCFGSSAVLFQNNINTWQHISLKSDGVKVYCYVNGVQTYTANINSVNKLPNLPYIHIAMRDVASKWKGSLNDFRFYDEALSVKEIKEIAKAKILHYSFNQFAEPTENRASNIHLGFSGSRWEKVSTYPNLPFKKQTDVYRRKDTNTYFGFATDFFKTEEINSPINGDKYAVSFWYYRESSSSPSPSVSIYGYNGSSNYVPCASVSYVGDRGVIGCWTYISCILTLTTTINNISKLTYLAGMAGSSIADGSHVYITNFQFEKKDLSTPYVSGTRIDRVTDSSGFKNHSLPLQLATTPQWTEDGVIGSGCYKFNGDNQIVTKQLFFDDKNQEWTVTGWAKLNVNNKTQSVNNFNLSNRLTQTTTQKALLYLNNGTEDSYVYSKTTIPTNEWYHFAFVVRTSDLTCKYYHNGVLDASSSNYTSTDFPLGFFSQTEFGVGLDGYLDDVRIYATALSDDDIKELYQSKGSISKNGKLTVNEIVEIGTTTHINKKGQLITKEIIEIPSVNLETKTAYGADWIQLFYHNNKSGTVLFSSDKKEFLKCNTGDKISNLYLMELFRGKDGKFEFLLEYESGGTSYNRWKQTSNFITEPIVGYEAVQCSWTNSYWGGLEPSNNTSTWVDGSVNHANWYYAIGARINYSTGGIPHWNGVEPGWVKIWVRCDNPSVFKMYKNGTVSATEFIEN